MDEISHNERYDFITKNQNIFSQRKIENYTYYIKDQHIVCTTKALPTAYLKPLPPKKIGQGKIITFDIETILQDNVHHPYHYSMYDGPLKIF